MRDHDDFDERFLQKGKERYESGHKSELLFCLTWCFANNVRIPDWLKEAIRKAHYTVTSYQVKSWDDVFGRPLKKGKRLATERRNVQIAQHVWEGVRNRHNAGQSINKSLFDEVGREVGVSGTIAAEIYYDLVKHFDAEAVGGDDFYINRGVISGKT